MIQIRKSLYLNNDNIQLSHDHEAIVIKDYQPEQEKQTTTRIPAALVEQIIIFGSITITSPFINFCIQHGITVSFVSCYGTYYGRILGKTKGNILLRKQQYDIYNEGDKRRAVVKNIILGKLTNQISTLRYYEHNVNKERSEPIVKAKEIISKQISLLKNAVTIDEIRGYEGVSAVAYFTALDYIITPTEDEMRFVQRSKRPPENNCNALLSFLYTMQNLSCISALETFGLDSYLGYLHEMRPGRESLANDLLEEMRAPLIDRFVVTLINRGQFKSRDFVHDMNGIRLIDTSRKRLLELWEADKNREILFPLTGKKVPIKLIPYLQAQLLSQHIRGDIDEYPPFYWDWRN